MAKKQTSKKKPAKKASTKVVKAEKVIKKTEKKESRITKMISFLRQVKSEGLKITWPTKQDTIHTSIVVLIMIFFFVLFFFVVDQLLGFVVNFILKTGA